MAERDKTTAFAIFVKYGWFMVLNTTVNNILVTLWRTVLLMEENGIPGENHRPVAGADSGGGSTPH